MRRNRLSAASRRIGLLLLALSVLAAALPAAAQAPPGLRLGVLFPGVIVDKDYNELGFAAMTAARKALGVEVAYRQRVTPADAPEAMRELIREGCTVIWGHGGQFMNAIL